MPCQSAQTTEVVSFANGQRQGIPKQSAQQTPAAEIQTWDISARVGDSGTIAPPYSAAVETLVSDLPGGAEAYIYIYLYIYIYIYLFKQVVRRSKY